MERFSIEALQPIGNSVWLAEVVVATAEQIGDIGVAQASRLKVRFKFDIASPVEELLQRAVDEAQRCLALSAAYLQEHTLPELLEEMEPKPFPPFHLDPE
ncbi:hypothetical protein [Novosphingobium sp. MBES04]|uniref:hypothetical protein n=1 Tax=Novosphingobium sp. MBES04 TaxID=1206458 RepID=UPI0005800126|nr:hypothetical protein [Novosphingobium sp. MBES04]